MNSDAMQTANVSLLFALGLSLLGSGCEQERPPLGKPICNAWKADVSALVQDSCGACHGSDQAEGGYSLDTYVAALALDPVGQPRVVPGLNTSKILTVFDTDTVHGDLQNLRPALTRWVVDCDARFVKTELHASGIMAPGHEDFHGALLRDNLYDLDACRQCHGEDLTGGGAEASCITCHSEGPDDCQTCHSDVMQQGAHARHMMPSPTLQPEQCETCHLVPTTLLSPNHVLTASGALDLAPVEVRLSLNAIGPKLDAPTPSFDDTTQRCVNVYCHGGSFDDAAAQRSNPIWTAEGPMLCDSCHGQPPTAHPGDNCVHCHLPSVSADNMTVDLTLHIDRIVQVGPPELGCGGCHGTPDNPAPGPDLEGRIDRTEVTVGLHDVHLFPRYGLRGPLACVDCHQMPENVLDDGHLNGGPAEVFPNIPGVATMARSDGALPTWNRETATCQDVYCHGGGDQMGLDTTPDLIREMVWNDPFRQQVYCGSCHGVPPTTPIHQSIVGIDRCGDCHAGTVDSFGQIIVNGEHIDGQFFR